jgi:ABC-type Co2+ transport system permease subunit
MPWRRFILAVVSGAGTTWVGLFVASIMVDMLAPQGPLLPVIFFVAALPVAVLGAFVAAMVASTYRRRRPDRETRCRKCGYILRGITEPRCPECGERI